MFGNANPSMPRSNTAPTGTTNLFGGGGGAAAGSAAPFNFGPPAAAGDPKPAAQPAAATSLFGAGSNTAAFGGFGGAPSTAAGGLFGSKPAAEAEKKEAAATPGGFGLFGAAGATGAKPATGGFNFGTPAAPGPSAAAIQPASSAATPAAAGGFAFGVPKTDAAPAAAASGSNATVGGGAGFGLGASTTAAMPSTTLGCFPAASQSAADPAKPAMEAAKPGLGNFPFGTATQSAAVVSTISTGAAADFDDLRLKGKTLDEILDMWYADLEETVTDFHRHAERIRERDMRLVENATAMYVLHTQVEELQNAQANVERTLEYVELQQKEIGAMLDVYEKEVDEVLSAAVLDWREADAERARVYELGANLSYQLDDMVRELAKATEGMDSLQSGFETDDAASQIMVILNSHLRSLDAIDRTIKDLQKRLGSMAGSRRPELTAPLGRR